MRLFMISFTVDWSNCLSPWTDR